MSKRLQVVLKDSEYRELQRFARAQDLTVSEWVRQTLRKARRDALGGDPARKLAVVRAAVRGDFPTADIQDMLAEIERGYLPPDGLPPDGLPAGGLPVHGHPADGEPR